MTDTDKAKKRDYMRKWRKANPERVRQHQINYWLRVLEAQKNANRGLNENDCNDH